MAACTCICHIPGSRVEMPDGDPCCFDSVPEVRRNKPTPKTPYPWPVRVSPASPLVYEGEASDA